MTQRGQLVEILKKERQSVLPTWMPDDAIHVLAEHLLQNNVMVLPCAVGTEVFCVAAPCTTCPQFADIPNKDDFEICKSCTRLEVIKCDFELDLVYDWGKTVFPTKEMAVAELERRKAEVSQWMNTSKNKP